MQTHFTNKYRIFSTKISKNNANYPLSGEWGEAGVPKAFVLYKGSALYISNTYLYFGFKLF